MTCLYPGSVYTTPAGHAALVMEVDEHALKIVSLDVETQRPVSADVLKLETIVPNATADACMPESFKDVIITDYDNTNVYMTEFMALALSPHFQDGIVECEYGSNKKVYCRFFKVHGRKDALPVLQGNLCHVQKRFYGNVKVFLNATGTLVTEKNTMTLHVSTILQTRDCPLSVCVFKNMWSLYNVMREPLVVRLTTVLDGQTIQVFYMDPNETDPVKKTLTVRDTSSSRVRCENGDAEAVELVFNEDTCITCKMNTGKQTNDILQICYVTPNHNVPVAVRAPGDVRHVDFESHMCMGRMQCVQCTQVMDASLIDMNSTHKWNGTCMDCQIKYSRKYASACTHPAVLKFGKFNDACNTNIATPQTVSERDVSAFGDLMTVDIKMSNECPDCNMPFIDVHGGVVCVSYDGTMTCTTCTINKLFNNYDDHYCQMDMGVLVHQGVAVQAVRAAARAWNIVWTQYVAGKGTAHDVKLKWDDLERKLFNASAVHNMGPWAYKARCTMVDVVGTLVRGRGSAIDSDDKIALTSMMRTLSRPVSGPARDMLDEIPKDNIMKRMLMKYPNTARKINAYKHASTLKLPTNDAWSALPPWLFHELDRTTGDFIDAFLESFWSFDEERDSGMCVKSSDTIPLPTLSEAIKMSVPWLITKDTSVPCMPPLGNVTCPKPFVARVGCESKISNIIVARVVTRDGPALVETCSRVVSNTAKEMWKRNFEELKGTHIPSVTLFFKEFNAHGIQNAVRACSGRAVPQKVAVTVSEVITADKKHVYAIQSMCDPANYVNCGSSIRETVKWVVALEGLYNDRVTSAEQRIETMANAYAPNILRKADACPWGSTSMDTDEPRKHLKNHIKHELKHSGNTKRVKCRQVEVKNGMVCVVHQHSIGDGISATYTSFLNLDSQGCVNVEIAYPLDCNIDTLDIDSKHITDGFKALRNVEFIKSTFDTQPYHVARCPFNSDIAAVCINNDTSVGHEVKRACIRAMMSCYKGQGVELPAETDTRMIIGKLVFTPGDIKFNILADTSPDSPLPGTLAHKITAVQPSTEFVRIDK